MPYDSPEFTVHQIRGPILASFASAALKLTASETSKTCTSANVHDRVEFFRNVKLTGIKAITRSMELLTGAISDNAPKVIVTEGTRVCATCALGTVAGLSTTGGISSTYPDIDSTETLQVKFKATGDNTAGTFGQVSADVYLEYVQRFE